MQQYVVSFRLHYVFSIVTFHSLYAVETFLWLFKSELRKPVDAGVRIFLAHCLLLLLVLFNENIVMNMALNELNTAHKCFGIKLSRWLFRPFSNPSNTSQSEL